MAAEERRAKTGYRLYTSGHLLSLTKHFMAVEDSLALLLDLLLPALLCTLDPLQDRVSSRRAAAHLWIYFLRIRKH